MKILIVGFGRSGTTLTYRIFRNHFQVRGAYLETCLLYFYNSKQLFKKYPSFKTTCCEKVIYGNDKIKKKSFGQINISIYDYCNMWLNRFGDEARIIQLIRHPLDTLHSLIAKRGRKMGLFTGFKIHLVSDEIKEQAINGYLNVVPKYAVKIAKLPNTKTIKYEDIITNKNTISNMYKFCNLEPQPFNEILRTKHVFGYKRNGFRIDKSINHIIDEFNKICKKGKRYEYPSS